MPKPATEKTASALKARVPLVVSVVVLTIATALNLLAAHRPACTEIYRRDVDVKVGKVVIAAQKSVAETDRQKGLSGKRCIGDKQAMLFIFDKPGYYPFWMKDMKFNIDIVWIASSLRVVDVKDNLSPTTFPKTFTNLEPAQYVLELGAGQAEKLNLVTGAQLSFKSY